MHGPSVPDPTLLPSHFICSPNCSCSPEPLCCGSRAPLSPPALQGLGTHQQAAIKGEGLPGCCFLLACFWCSHCPCRGTPQMKEGTRRTRKQEVTSAMQGCVTACVSSLWLCSQAFGWLRFIPLLQTVMGLVPLLQDKPFCL